MIYLILSILITPIILFIFIKDEITILKIISITSFISSIILTIISYLLKTLIKNKISFLNTTKITTYIINNFYEKTIIFLTVSILTFILYKILKKFKTTSSKKRFALVKPKNPL